MPASNIERHSGHTPCAGRHVTAALAIALGSATWARAALAGEVVAHPDALRAAVVGVSTGGSLCPEGSVGVALSEGVVTVILSRSAAGVETARCTLTLDLEVPAGFSMGMPTTILRGVALGQTRLERRYAFDGAGASDAFLDGPGEDFVIAETAPELESRSCSGAGLVRYTVDVTAQLQAEATFFQLDSIDVDTSFRFGTEYALCDATRTLVIAAGEAGEFCGGPQGRPCAAPLRCELEPSSGEGTCSAL